MTPRGLSHGHVNKLVCVEGVVTSMTTVAPRVTQSIFYCKDPSAEVEEWAQVKRREHRDNTNLLWQNIVTDVASVKEDDHGNVWKEELGLCEYKDQQRIVVQEAPENAPTGRIPTSVEAIVEQDLVNTVKPGDRVRMVGVYRAFPTISNDATNGIFPMRIICNNVKNVRESILKTQLSMTDTKGIKEISRRQDFFELLSRSFAPSISGNSLVKQVQFY